MSQAFIYTRISEDRDGSSVAPERQEASARELASREGFTVAGVYTDRDTSASKPSVRRPQFERLLVDAERERATVLAWNQDRLLRQPMDAERVILAGIPVRTVVGDTGMMSDAQARLMVRIKAAVGMHETDLMALRLREKAKQTAESGAAHPGRRAFGHEPGQTAEHPQEAAIVRELVARVLAGERLSELVRQLRAEGITATTGRAFTLTSLRYVLTCARIAGARELPDGSFISTGAIAPLVRLEDLLAVRRTISARRSSSSSSSRARRHLLAGFVYCGRCGNRMVADGGSSWQRYRCPSPRGVVHAGCGGVSMSAAPLEGYVSAQILEELDRSAAELAAALADQEATDSPVSAALRELAAVDALRLELVEDRAEGIVDRAEFRRMADRLEQRRSAAERELAQHERASARARLPIGEAARAAWSSGDLHYRRSVIAALVERITITPREGGRGGRFDSSRVHITWSA